MDYALNLLQSKLDNELKELEIANQMLKGKGFTMNPDTQKAFERSRDIAYTRIDELYNAIKKINL
jgi:hypothetical protein